uniref:Pectinesterase n=1 Tax=Kalanchoe fedtschenkoi TaxID=63787 RepID=A0A7N0U602_KALFE
MSTYENEKKKRRVAIISISSIILIAMVVAVTVGVSQSYHSAPEKSDQTATKSSSKAVSALCQTTDHKEICEDSLKPYAGNTTDPKELIKIAFNVTIQHITEAARKSSTLRELEKDARTSGALENCHEMMEYSINDLKASFKKIGTFEVSKMDDILADLKVWLSAAITYQETCLDGFENTTGTAEGKMRDALSASTQLTSNSLAMVTQLSDVFTNLHIPGVSVRRLLGAAEYPVVGHDGYPGWFESGQRNLLSTNPSQLKPNVVVAKDGSGDYKTLSDAVHHIPKKSNKTFVIYVKEGIYEEQVIFNSSLTNVFLYGDGPTKTKITGSLNYADGITTSKTATVIVLGDFFTARDIGFENSAGPEKHQAVALRVQSDFSVFQNCRMDGYQDTLYTHTKRQYYRDCVVTGTIDFVFGDSPVLFQNCTFMVRKPNDNQFNAVTAQGRKERRQPSGIVIQGSRIIADPELESVKADFKSYLGRPWKAHSRTIIMETFIDDFIAPEGWTPWAGDINTENCLYGEYHNSGPGASLKDRVKWKGIKKISKDQAVKYTADYFLGAARWLPQKNVKYTAGLSNKA